MPKWHARHKSWFAGHVAGGIQLVYSCACRDVNNEIVKCWQINLRISRRFTYANERHLSQILLLAFEILPTRRHRLEVRGHVGSHKYVCSSGFWPRVWSLELVVWLRSRKKYRSKFASWKNLSRNTKLAKGGREWWISWNGRTPVRHINIYGC